MTQGFIRDGISTMDTGNTLWVDAVFGDDATAQPERMDLPYETIAAAKAAASSGDTIVVRRGTYNENDIQKDGVDIAFDPGAYVNYVGSSALGVIDDSAGPIVAKYVGGNDLSWESSASTDSATINLVDAASDIQIDAGTIYGQWTGVSSPGHAPAVIWGFAGNGQISAKEIVLGDAAPNGQYVIGWTDGALHIKADVIRSDEAANTGGVAAVTSPATTTGEFWVEAQQIKTNVSMQCPGSDARMWVRAMDISVDSSGLQTVYASGGRFYVEAMRIKNAAADGVAIRNEGGILWLNAQKVTASGASGIAVSLVDGTTDADILQIEDEGSLGTAIACDFGTHVIKNARFVGGASANGVVMNGGTLTLENCYINTAANSSGNPVVMNGGTIILKNCTLVAEATRDSIEAASPQTVISYGSYANTSVDANVTASGDLTIGAYVQ